VNNQSSKATSQDQDGNCPECGGTMAVAEKTHEKTTVRIAACKAENCDYFYWETPDGNLDFEGVADWAIEQSLRILQESSDSAGPTSLKMVFEEVSPRA